MIDREQRREQIMCDWLSVDSNKIIRLDGMSTFQSATRHTTPGLSARLVKLIASRSGVASGCRRASCRRHATFDRARHTRVLEARTIGNGGEKMSEPAPVEVPAPATPAESGSDAAAPAAGEGGEGGVSKKAAKKVRDAIRAVRDSSTPRRRSLTPLRPIPKP